jgi:Flp pilus assembly protein TadB
MLSLPLEAKLIGVALAAAAVLGWFAWHDHQVREQATASIRAEVAQATIKAQQEAATETARRVQAQSEIANDAHAQAEHARADADAAAAARDRLRDRLAAVVASAGHPSSATGSEAAGDPIGVLAVVLGRADERAGLLADLADKRGIAGAACERAYDALKP